MRYRSLKNRLPNAKDKYTSQETALLSRLHSPEKIQKFLDSLDYNLRDTAFSPRLVMEKRTAHCLEGAVFAAAALEFHGEKPLIWDLEAERDSDHVLALFRQGALWGAIASSNFSGLRFRPAVFRSLRELALSFFPSYFNLRGQYTLRRYSGPVSLLSFDSQHWRTTEKPIWFIAEKLCEIPHKNLIEPKVARSLPLVDQRQRGAGKWGMRGPQ
jgi:hypothetical protein